MTTTVGLFPMLFETSTQARFLVPMAIALSFGTVASTFVVLLLIPALHEIWADICRLFGLREPPAHDRQPISVDRRLTGVATTVLALGSPGAGFSALSPSRMPRVL